MPSSAILLLKAVVVPQNTLQPLISCCISSPFLHASERLFSKWLLYFSLHPSSLPKRMKSIPSSTNLLHISSTALFVNDNSNTELPSSNNSSFSTFSIPNEVFPVPGGPIIKNKSLACLTLNTSSLNSAFPLFV